MICETDAKEEQFNTDSPESTNLEAEEVKYCDDLQSDENT